MIRLSYWGHLGRNQWFWFKRTRTLTGHAFHFGPFSLFVDTDRLP